MASQSKLQPKLYRPAVHTAGIFSGSIVDGSKIGTLLVVVDRAKNLPDRKMIGKQNPYCAVRLGKEAKKTDTIHRGGQTPKWNQELRFTVHDSPDYYQIKVSVFNDDKKIDLIGETNIDLKDIIVSGEGQNNVWYHLLFKGKYAGEIRAKITYNDIRSVREKPRKPIQKTGSSVVIRTTHSSTSLQSLGTPDEVSKFRTISPATEIKFSPKMGRFSEHEYEASINSDRSKNCTRFPNEEKISSHDTSKVTSEHFQIDKDVANDVLNKNLKEVSETTPKNLSQLNPNSCSDTHRIRPYGFDSRENLQYRHQRTSLKSNLGSFYKYPSASGVDGPLYPEDASPPPPPIHRTVNTNNHLSFDQLLDSHPNLVSHFPATFFGHSCGRNPEVTQVPYQNNLLVHMAPYSSRIDDQIPVHQNCSAEEQREKFNCSPKENNIKISSQAHKFGPRQNKNSCESSFL